jgi:hypothetical protein
MPVSHEKHGSIPVAVSIVLCGLDQLFNFGLGQVLSAVSYMSNGRIIGQTIEITEGFDRCPLSADAGSKMTN